MQYGPFYDASKFPKDGIFSCAEEIMERKRERLRNPILESVKSATNLQTIVTTVNTVYFTFAVES